MKKKTTFINIRGDTFTRKQVRDLIERLNEEAADGGKIVITKNWPFVDVLVAALLLAAIGGAIASILTSVGAW